MIPGIAIRMEISLISGKELFRMLRSSAWLVLMQKNEFICISARPVQPLSFEQYRKTYKFLHDFQS